MVSCRFCQKRGMHPVIDLGHTPPSNSFLTKEQLLDPEVTYPLKLFVCDSCFLVQIDECKEADEIFREDYVYFSSQSPSNVSHAKEFANMMMERFAPKNVLEIGSNDGYMLQWFKEKGCAVQGVDPAEGAAAVAISKGVTTDIAFFNKYWKEYYDRGEYEIICGINTLAHQPDINDFVKCLRLALAPKGVIVMEFPHLMRLIDECQFDTIYHEHYSYFSFATVCEIFRRHGLEVFDVDEIPEHGGSLRVYAQHDMGDNPARLKVITLLRKEHQKGMASLRYYDQFQGRVDRTKHKLVRLLLLLSKHSKKVCAYGAAAKGNTLLNYCGVRPDLLSYVVDRSPHKQGKYLPGSHIPVTDEAFLKRTRPDYVLILPWNLKVEIMEQLSYIREWGGKFVIPLPDLEVI